MATDTVDILHVLLSVLIPPLGVFLQEGLGTQFGISLLLTLLGYIPGLLHAIWVTTGLPVIPPLSVFLEEGLGTQFWINLILTLLGYILGLVHAVWIIARR